MAEGGTVVVDLDLEKFFDRVNHDILMSRVARRIGDKRLLRIIRRFLEAGTAAARRVRRAARRDAARRSAVPLAWPICCWMIWTRNSNGRGHKFCRYADDCNIYVQSQAAGERVLASVTRFLEGRLRLRVNRQKSAAAPVWERKFLGHRLLADGTLTIAPKSLDRAKDRIREITRRNRGVSFERMVRELNSFLLGWVTYFPPREGQVATWTSWEVGFAANSAASG